MRTTIDLFVAIVFLTAAVYSAQGEEPMPAPAEVPNACALLSRLAVEDASGVPFAEGVPVLRIRNVTACSFEGEHGGRAIILVRLFPTGDWVTEQVARMKRGVVLGTFREMRGVGERSFLYTSGGRGAVLCVFGADYYLQISFFWVGEQPRIPAALERLATSALARLHLSGRRQE